MKQDALAIPDLEDRADDGIAMQRLTAQQRQFVIASLTVAMGPGAYEKCAAMAAFDNPRKAAAALMRNDKVLAAMREEAAKRLVGAALTGVNVMLQIAGDPTHKDQYRAAKDLAAINGFTVEQKIVVEHTDRSAEALISQIRATAARLGVDAAPLLAQAGIVDAEFTALPAPAPAPETQAEVDDSDW